MLRIICVTLVIGLAALAAGAAAAAEWPSSVTVGGFTVSRIVGTVNPDGSGRATGRLEIVGDGTCRVDLARSASRVITGSTRASFTLGGVRIDGSFMLDRDGLRGVGAVHTGARPVSDANISVSPRGGASGRGRINFGPGFSVGVTFEVKEQAVAVNGSAERQVSVDTPLALYTFRGEIEVSASGTGLKTMGKGSVERKGKIGGTVSTFGPLAFEVDCRSGEAQVGVGGTTISFDLW